jgi:hypothetical protein
MAEALGAELLPPKGTESSSMEVELERWSGGGARWSAALHAQLRKLRVELGSVGDEGTTSPWARPATPRRRARTYTKEA